MRKILPPTLYFFMIALMTGVFFLDPTVPINLGPVSVIGGVFTLAGLILAFLGSRLFRIVKTNIHTFDKPDKLVTSGLFKHSRNPMYLGFILSLFGIALIFGTIWSLILAVIFAVIVDRWYVKFEEDMMNSVFGEAYRSYCKFVRRWV